MSVWQHKAPGKFQGKWAYKFKALDGRQVKGEGFLSREEALDAEAQRRLEIKTPPPPPKPVPIGTTFSALCEAYLDYTDGRFQANTRRQKMFVFRTLIRFHADRTVNTADRTANHVDMDLPPGDFLADAIDTQTIEAFLSHQRQLRGPKAANRDLRDIKALYAWGLRRGLVYPQAVAQVAVVAPYPEDRPSKYVPPIEDFTRVLLAAQGDDRDLLLVLYHTAARKGEVLERLTWDDVNFENRYVRLHTRKRKGGGLEGRTIPMNSILYDVLWRRWNARKMRKVDVVHRDGQVVHPDAPEYSPYVFVSAKTSDGYTRAGKRNLLQRLCETAGVKPFTLHAIRHLVASVLSDSHKASPRQIQAFLGHKRIDTTEIYLHEIRPLADVSDILSNTEGTKNGDDKEGKNSR